LARKLNAVSLDAEEDKPIWRWTKNKMFSIKSMYLQLTKLDNGNAYNVIWKSKTPEKVKIFMWPVAQKAILTKDNIRRKWQGDPGCYFCGCPETVDHLLLSCPVAKVIWGIVAICFGQHDRPSSYEQYWLWVKKAIPGGDPVFMLGLAAICWAIWKARNKTCFEEITYKRS
jgi:hypothetical protein